MLLPALTLLLAPALAFRLQPEWPPVHVGDQDGRALWELAPGVILPVDPAIVLELEPGTTPPVGARALGGNYYRVPAERPIEAAWALLGARGVRDVMPDVRLEQVPTGVSFDDPAYGGQWYLEDLGMEALYAVSLGSPEIRVAVIDSGIDIRHPDLIDAVIAPFDAANDDDDPSPDPGEFCTDGSDDICDVHGTATSGVVLARANNQDGIVGMCPQCTLIPIKLLSDGGGTAMSADIAAFGHAAANGAAVINNSWGFTESTPVPDMLARAIRDAANDARDGLGAVILFAAGNDDRVISNDEMQAMDEVLCISATDTYGYPAAYTNQGDSVDLAAPSASVTIGPNDSVVEDFGGTSGAAPVAAGLAAWAASVDPSLSGVELGELLVNTATPSPYVPDTDHHPIYGYGNLSAAGVLAALSEPVEIPKEDPGEDPAAACGCASGTRGASPLIGLGVWVGLGLLGFRRRDV